MRSLQEVCKEQIPLCPKESHSFGLLDTTLGILCRLLVNDMILGIIGPHYLRELSNDVLRMCSGGSEEVLHVVVAAAALYGELVDGEGSR